MEQKQQAMARFLQEKFINASNQLDLLALADFIGKPADEQKLKIVEWLEERKQYNVSQKAALPAKKLEAEAALESDNTNIQSVIDSL